MIDIDDAMANLTLSDDTDIYDALEIVMRIIITSEDLDDSWLVTLIDYDDVARYFNVSQDYTALEIKRWFIEQGVERENIKIRN